MVAGGRVPRPIAEGDVCHGSGPLPEVVGPRSKQPSDADRQGELLPCYEPVDPHAQVLGRRVFRVIAGVARVAFQACVVQMLRRLKLHGIKRQKVPKIHGLKKHQKNHSLACKKSSRF